MAKNNHVSWKDNFSAFETNEEALIRMFNDPRLLEKAGGRQGYLDYLAGRFSATKMTINKKLGRLRREDKIGYLPKSDVPFGTKKVITLDKKFPPGDTPEKLLKLIIDGNDILNERDVRQEEVSPQYDWKGWTGLVIGGDWHFEHYRTDARSVVNTLKELGQEPHLFFGFNGDALDVLRLRFLELENETLDIPMRRRYEVVKYLFTLIPNTLFIVCGCHDNWIRTRAMYDVLEDIQEQILGYYIGFGGTVNFRLGNVVYRIAACHKFGWESQNNHFHPNYNYLKKMDASADIIAIAHRHDIVGVSHVYWQDKDRIMMRSGSQQYKTNYAWKEGFKGAVDRYPMVLLNGTERRMIVGVNYREGIPMLRFLNKEYERNAGGTPT